MDLQWTEKDEHGEEDIPLFMDELPEAGTGNDAVDALRAVIDEEDTAEVRAEDLKDKGNQALKRGLSHRPVALAKYTEALAQRCQDAQLNAIIYANRAHVHMLNKNWGRALKDCQAAIKADPQNIKPYFRAAKCCNSMHKPKFAAVLAEKGLRLDKVGLEK